MPVLGFSGVHWLKNDNQQNNAPVVRLISPSSTKNVQWNSMISYKISVTDKEDGISDYNEIPANEVFLKIKFIPDSTKAKTYIQWEKNNLPDSRGISLIKSFSCFTCHQVKTKLIGPSFDSIALKYPSSAITYEKLATKIMKGSKSVWGSAEMPPHPDLSSDDAKQMVKWIFENCSDPNVNYIVGLEGVFRTQSKPVTHPEKAMYVLTASYTDHGLSNIPNSKKCSQDMIILRSSTH